MANALDEAILTKTAYRLARDADLGEIIRAGDVSRANEREGACAHHPVRSPILDGRERVSVRQTKCDALQHGHREFGARVTQQRCAVKQCCKFLTVHIDEGAACLPLRSGKIGEKLNLSVTHKPGSGRENHQAAAACHRDQPIEPIRTVRAMMPFEIVAAPQACDGLFLMNIASIERTGGYHAATHSRTTESRASPPEGRSTIFRLSTISTSIANDINNDSQIARVY
jgi:hypothetical protein